MGILSGSDGWRNRASVGDGMGAGVAGKGIDVMQVN